MVLQNNSQLLNYIISKYQKCIKSIKGSRDLSIIINPFSVSFLLKQSDSGSVQNLINVLLSSQIKVRHEFDMLAQRIDEINSFEVRF